MKWTDTVHAFVIRMILFIIALIFQLICALRLPIGSYYIFLCALKCLDFGVVLLFVGSSYQVWKKNVYPYLCVMLDCAGILMSFFSYQKFILGFTTSDSSGPQKFVIGPYLVFSILAWVMWSISKRTDWYYTKKIQFIFSTHKSGIGRAFAYALMAVSVVFLLAGVYLFALESFLLAGWAVLTGILMLYAGYKARQ